MLGILPQYIHITNHPRMYFKYCTVLFVSYTSVKLRVCVWGSLQNIYAFDLEVLPLRHLFSGHNHDVYKLHLLC